MDEMTKQIIETPSRTPDSVPMGKFKSGWMLFKQSLAVLLSDKELLWFPLLSSFFAIIVTTAYIFFFILTEVSMWSSISGLNSGKILMAVLLFLYYLIIAFITTYFKGALTAVAYARLQGGNMSFSDGVHASNKKIGKILGWALISATVGVILKNIERRGRWIGWIISLIMGTAWNLATFFIIPSIMLEEGGPIDTVKQSTGTFKKAWGEVLVTSISFGFVIFLLGFIPLVIGVTVFGFFEYKHIFQSATDFTVGMVSMVIWLLWVIFLGMVSSALSSIFNTALYIYAKSGTAPIQFSPEIIAQAVLRKL